MDYVKLTKRVWKSVFGKEPLCEIVDNNPLTIRVDDFTLIQCEGEIENKTICGTERQKVMGWAADVFVSTYSYQDGIDGDTVDLAWARNFMDALLLIVEASARQLADNVMQEESMAEDYAESERLLAENPVR